VHYSQQLRHNSRYAQDHTAIVSRYPENHAAIVSRYPEDCAASDVRISQKSFLTTGSIQTSHIIVTHRTMLRWFQPRSQARTPYSSHAHQHLPRASYNDKERI
jgi:hypothetical protein